MRKGKLAKLLFILSTIVLAVLLILPTIGKKTMKIVLKDGIEVNSNNYKALVSRFPEENFTITKDKKEKNIIYVKGFNISDAKMNDVRTSTIVKDAEIMPHFFSFAKKINLGLDLQGGMLLVLQADYSELERQFTAKDKDYKLSDAEKKDITEQAIESITRRIEKEVAEPLIRPRGTEAIEVQLPGVKDPERVKTIIGKTGVVKYQLVNEPYTQRANEYLRRDKEIFKDDRFVFPEKYLERKALLERVSTAINIPSSLELLYYYDMDRKTNEKFISQIIALEVKASLTGQDFESALVVQDEYRQIAVSITASSEGALKFAEVTSAKNKERRLAIAIDGEVITAPYINTPITTGKGTITGAFTSNEAKVLERVIKEGALPVKLNIIEERTVGPSLGQDSIEAGVKAIFIGLILVLVFMIIFYKGSGIIADICLILNLVFMLALLSYTGATLTLPGIAGLILTVGMSVDANVIIYERIKEEIRNGKSAKVAVKHGFERAFWTIFDANLTTLIAACILSLVGTGPIKGFAVTLIFGILCSMFVALFIAKFIYEFLTSTMKITKLSI